MSEYRQTLNSIGDQTLFDGGREQLSGREIRAIREALTRMAEIEEGKSVVVPVEPTDKMLIEGALGMGYETNMGERILKYGMIEADDAYKAMIAAREGK